ncbi:LysR family transcriptional regulator [Ramlibacter alkalitolerans]|uniref:LysR family transcriptional regulator n=1 Tax=Ramlibacter alkalitolerans TaxID=2039631 RepID=A0ABS1JTB6_9BURK|nr:LysR family transcriptional regulator [Ramlibacter alkalitolerans]MBL0427483.1 LysR family transcriptional regulator [Ramlibacter alkalitolerans]
MDRFEEMRAFAAVVDAGSFVRAAEALNVSKTAVSRLVGDLEARLGVRLLHRTTRKLSLSVEGEVFHARCRELLAELQEAEAEVTARADEAVGLLRVNVPVSFGLLQLAPLWPAFLEQHPRVVLDVTLSDRIVDLVDEGYDLAVRIAQLPTSSLVSRKLASTRMMLCASPGYLRRHGTPAHPSEVSAHSVVAYTLLATGEQWVFEGPEGSVTVKVTPRMRTNSGDTCIAAALQHRGIVLQPSFMVGPHLRAGELVELLPQYRSRELGIYAVYPSRKHLTPKVRVLIDFLLETFRIQPWAG